MSRKPLGQEVSEEDVLNAAKKIFCEYGFDNTNLNDIARELNTTRTPIYYYFENKQNLYEAVVKKHLTGKLDMPLERVLESISATCLDFAGRIDSTYATTHIEWGMGKPEGFGG